MGDKILSNAEIVRSILLHIMMMYENEVNGEKFLLGSMYTLTEMDKGYLQFRGVIPKKEDASRRIQSVSSSKLVKIFVIQSGVPDEYKDTIGLVESVPFSNKQFGNHTEQINITLFMDNLKSNDSNKVPAWFNFITDLVSVVYNVSIDELIYAIKNCRRKQLRVYNPFVPVSAIYLILTMAIDITKKLISSDNIDEDIDFCLQDLINPEQKDNNYFYDAYEEKVREVAEKLIIDTNPLSDTITNEFLNVFGCYRLTEYLVDIEEEEVSGSHE